MIEAGKKAFRNIFSRLSLKFVLMQWIGFLVLALMTVVWLQLPDSHVWQFALSILLALVLSSAALAFLAVSFRWLRKPVSASPLWLRGIWILLFVAVWWLLQKPIDLGRAHEDLYAGYWNSKLSHHWRIFFSYPRLMSWQEHFYDLVVWLVNALLLPWTIEAGAVSLRASTWKNVSHVYRRWFYWLATFIVMLVGVKITSLLVNWTPGKGLAGEIISLLLRLSVAYTIDVLLWCFVIALVVEYLSRVRPKLIEQ